LYVQTCIHQDKYLHVTPPENQTSWDLPSRQKERHVGLRSVELGERFWQMSFALQQGRQVATRAVLQHQHQTFAVAAKPGHVLLQTTRRSKLNEGLGTTPGPAENDHVSMPEKASNYFPSQF
jgi:hypothetical protein